MQVTQCALCRSEELVSLVDLGLHPLADTFVRDQDTARSLPRYPLTVLRCTACGHAMNGFRVPPEKRYRGAEYSYDSSNSKVAEKHFDELALSVASSAGLKPDDLVVDIGGNVGTLLLAFRRHAGARIFNIEPAPNIAALAEKNEVPTLSGFWDAAAAERITKEGGAAVITATNAFNHIDDLDAFFTNLSTALKPGGTFVAEVPYLLTLIERSAFDTMYLEHVSYFAVRPLRDFLAKRGLRIMRAELTDYMGGSITLCMGTGDEGGEVGELIAREEEYGLYDEPRYEDFRARVKGFKDDLLTQLRKAKEVGGVIIGIGAATKGNTLLNYCGIDDSMLAYITDVSPLKVGKFTPGSAIPIKHDDELGADATHALILPWNIGAFLKEKLSKKHPSLSFIVPHMVE